MKNNIGLLIKNARIQKGYTQEALAEIVGVQKSAVAKWENGRVTEIKRSNLIALADALEIEDILLLGNSSLQKTKKTVTIESDGLSELDLKFVSLIKQLSDQEKAMLIAQIEGLLQLRGH